MNKNIILRVFICLILSLIVHVSSAQSFDAKAMLDSVEVYIRTNEIEDARKAEKLLKNNKTKICTDLENRKRYNSYLSEALSSLGQFKEIIELLNSISPEEYEKDKYWTDLFIVNYVVDDNVAAKECIKHINLDKDVEENMKSTFWGCYAKVYFSQGEKEEALDCLSHFNVEYDELQIPDLSFFCKYIKYACIWDKYRWNKNQIEYVEKLCEESECNIKDSQSKSFVITSLYCMLAASYYVLAQNENTDLSLEKKIIVYTKFVNSYGYLDDNTKSSFRDLYIRLKSDLVLQTMRDKEVPLFDGDASKPSKVMLKILKDIDDMSKEQQLSVLDELYYIANSYNKQDAATLCRFILDNYDDVLDDSTSVTYNKGCLARQQFAYGKSRYYKNMYFSLESLDDKVNIHNIVNEWCNRIGKCGLKDNDSFDCARFFVGYFQTLGDSVRTRILLDQLISWITREREMSDNISDYIPYVYSNIFGTYVENLGDAKKLEYFQDLAKSSLIREDFFTSRSFDYLDITDQYRRQLLGEQYNILSKCFNNPSKDPLKKEVIHNYLDMLSSYAGSCKNDIIIKCEDDFISLLEYFEELGNNDNYYKVSDNDLCSWKYTLCNIHIRRGNHFTALKYLEEAEGLDNRHDQRMTEKYAIDYCYIIGSLYLKQIINGKVEWPIVAGMKDKAIAKAKYISSLYGEEEKYMKVLKPEQRLRYWSLKLSLKHTEIQKILLLQDEDIDGTIYNNALFEKGLFLRMESDSERQENKSIGYATDWHQVRDALTDNDIAIEFIVSRDYRKDLKATLEQKPYHKERYFAIILKKGYENPKIVELADYNTIGVLLENTNKIRYDRFINQTYKNGNPNINRGDKIYEVLIKPLENELEGVKTIYYSPIGYLNEIAFEALGHDNTPLIDRFNLVRMSSTREILNVKKGLKSKELNRATLYGGIKYSAEKSELIEEASTYNDGNSKSNIELAMRSGWNYLPGTKVEADSIKVICSNKKIKTSILSEQKANEESFKALSGVSPNLIHLATHGFYVSDNKEIKNNKFFQRLGVLDDNYQNALLRSGMLFAGANNTWLNDTPIEGIEDGILTAAEVANLDLSNTQLVTLSACETGLGHFVGNEGVFGLQRGFKIAGVQTIVMSLWKVPDLVTSLFMECFYNRWLNGEEIHSAFQNAKREIKEKYPNPHQWAGFVMLD